MPQGSPLQGPLGQSPQVMMNGQPMQMNQAQMQQVLAQQRMAQLRQQQAQANGQNIGMMNGPSMHQAQQQALQEQVQQQHLAEFEARKQMLQQQDIGMPVQIISVLPVEQIIMPNLVDDEDPYTMRCICEYKDDDGNTIYCEQCDTWQHTECYYPGRVSEASRADFQHACVQCKPRDLNVQDGNVKQQSERENKISGNASLEAMLRHTGQSNGNPTAELSRSVVGFLCSYEGCERGILGNGFPHHWNLKDHMTRVHDDPDTSDAEIKIEMDRTRRGSRDGPPSGRPTLAISIPRHSSQESSRTSPQFPFPTKGRSLSIATSSN